MRCSIGRLRFIRRWHRSQVDLVQGVFEQLQLPQVSEFVSKFVHQFIEATIRLLRLSAMAADAVSRQKLAGETSADLARQLQLGSQDSTPSTSDSITFSCQFQSAQRSGRLIETIGFNPESLQHCRE